MDHPCHNCSAQVEDGVNFCPHCNAPQIRVSIAAEPNTAAGQPVDLPRTLPSRSYGEIDWQQALPVAALAGGGVALAGLLTEGLLGPASAVWMIVGGAITVALYRRRRPFAAMRPRVGARLGAITGLFSFITFAVLNWLILLAEGGEELRQEMTKAVQQAAAQNPDPRVQEMMAKFTTPEGIAVLIAMTFVAFLIIFVIFGAIGGSLWASRERH